MSQTPSHNGHPFEGRTTRSRSVSSPNMGPSDPLASGEQGLTSYNRYNNKSRKSYTMTKTRELWTSEEHEKFLQALALYSRDWKAIEDYIGTKSVVQIRSHAQKHFLKMQKLGLGGDVPQARHKKDRSNLSTQTRSKAAALNTQTDTARHEGSNADMSTNQLTSHTESATASGADLSDPALAEFAGKPVGDVASQAANAAPDFSLGSVGPVGLFTSLSYHNKPTTHGALASSLLQNNINRPPQPVAGSPPFQFPPLDADNPVHHIPATVGGLHSPSFLPSPSMMRNVPSSARNVLGQLPLTRHRQDILDQQHSSHAYPPLPASPGHAGLPSMSLESALNHAPKDSSLPTSRSTTLALPPGLGSPSLISTSPIFPSINDPDSLTQTVAAASMSPLTRNSLHSPPLPSSSNNGLLFQLNDSTGNFFVLGPKGNMINLTHGRNTNHTKSQSPSYLRSPLSQSSPLMSTAILDPHEMLAHISPQFTSHGSPVSVLTSSANCSTSSLYNPSLDPVSPLLLPHRPQHMTHSPSRFSPLGTAPFRLDISKTQQPPSSSSPVAVASVPASDLKSETTESDETTKNETSDNTVTTTVDSSTDNTMGDGANQDSTTSDQPNPSKPSSSEPPKSDTLSLYGVYFKHAPSARSLIDSVKNNTPHPSLVSHNNNNHDPTSPVTHPKQPHPKSPTPAQSAFGLNTSPTLSTKSSSSTSSSSSSVTGGGGGAGDDSILPDVIPLHLTSINHLIKSSLLPRQLHPDDNNNNTNQTQSNDHNNSAGGASGGGGTSTIPTTLPSLSSRIRTISSGIPNISCFNPPPTLSSNLLRPAHLTLHKPLDTAPYLWGSQSSLPWSTDHLSHFVPASSFLVPRKNIHLDLDQLTAKSIENVNINNQLTGPPAPGAYNLAWTSPHQSVSKLIIPTQMRAELLVDQHRAQSRTLMNRTIQTMFKDITRQAEAAAVAVKGPDGVPSDVIKQYNQTAKEDAEQILSSVAPLNTYGATTTLREKLNHFKGTLIDTHGLQIGTILFSRAMSFIQTQQWLDDALDVVMSQYSRDLHRKFMQILEGEHEHLTTRLAKAISQAYETISQQLKELPNDSPLRTELGHNLQKLSSEHAAQLSQLETYLSERTVEFNDNMTRKVNELTSSRYKIKIIVSSLFENSLHPQTTVERLGLFLSMSRLSQTVCSLLMRNMYTNLTQYNYIHTRLHSALTQSDSFVSQYNQLLTTVFPREDIVTLQLESKHRSHLMRGPDGTYITPPYVDPILADHGRLILQTFDNTRLITIGVRDEYNAFVQDSQPGQQTSEIVPVVYFDLATGQLLANRPMLPPDTSQIQGVRLSVVKCFARIMELHAAIVILIRQLQDDNDRAMDSYVTAVYREQIRQETVKQMGLESLPPDQHLPSDDMEYVVLGPQIRYGVTFSFTLDQLAAAPNQDEILHTTITHLIDIISALEMVIGQHPSIVAVQHQDLAIQQQQDREHHQTVLRQQQQQEELALALQNQEEQRQIMLQQEHQHLLLREQEQQQQHEQQPTQEPSLVQQTDDTQQDQQQQQLQDQQEQFQAQLDQQHQHQFQTQQLEQQQFQSQLDQQQLQSQLDQHQQQQQFQSQLDQHQQQQLQAQHDQHQQQQQQVDMAFYQQQLQQQQDQQQQQQYNDYMMYQNMTPQQQHDAALYQQQQQQHQHEMALYHQQQQLYQQQQDQQQQQQQPPPQWP